ncbi:hypothetical protein SKC37_03760 [Aquirufa sp. HETE-83D]|uniref:DUF4142 domain-containing protein n=1 Tax=Aquirufa esocilacus TaxID=3096513 RepID=A0ABW6DJ78_9BACT
MFSTLFYLLLLFYDGLFSKSTSEYNAEISSLNKQMAAKDYQKALGSAHSIMRSRLFNNNEIEAVVATLELKVAADKRTQAKQIQLTANSLENDILKSHYIAKYGNSKKGLADLHQSILNNGSVDTLVKAYELYAFYFPQNKLKKQARSTQMISQTQKINTQEALSLLNLMKKKQKNLIY